MDQFLEKSVICRILADTGDTLKSTKKQQKLINNKVRGCKTLNTNNQTKNRIKQIPNDKGKNKTIQKPAYMRSKS